MTRVHCLRLFLRGLFSIGPQPYFSERRCYECGEAASVWACACTAALAVLWLTFMLGRWSA